MIVNGFCKDVLQHLPMERVWVELERALGERDPDVFVSVLRECGALHALLPEVEQLFGVPQNAEHHPEIDTGVHLLMTLQQAAKLSDSTAVMMKRQPASANSARCSPRFNRCSTFAVKS